MIQVVELPNTSLSPIRFGFVSVFVNYKTGCTRLAAASDKVYQLLVHGRWFSPASSTTKTGRHDIAEILLKVALSTINQIKSKSNHLQNEYLFSFRSGYQKITFPKVFFFPKENHPHSLKSQNNYKIKHPIELYTLGVRVYSFLSLLTKQRTSLNRSRVGVQFPSNVLRIIFLRPLCCNVLRLIFLRPLCCNVLMLIFLGPLCCNVLRLILLS